MIRADGEKLYGGVGSLPGDQLPQMLIAALKLSGRAFNQGDALLLNQAVAESKAALDRGESLRAAIALSAVNKLGSPNQLGSYAAAAVQAGSLYEEIQSKLEADAKAAQERLSASQSESEDASNPEQWLTAAAAICEAEAAYKLFPDLRRKSADFAREFRTKDTYRELFAQAEGIVRARSLTVSANLRMRNRAVKAYIDVMRRFPNTEADRLARAELNEFDPDAVVPDAGSLNTKPTPEPSNDSFRTWTARQGNFTTRAKYVQQAGGKVQLMKTDGSKIVVDISILSDQDQAFLRRLRP